MIQRKSERLFSENSGSSARKLWPGWNRFRCCFITRQDSKSAPVTRSFRPLSLTGFRLLPFPSWIPHQHFARKIDRLQCDAGKLVPVLPSEVGFHGLWIHQTLTFGFGAINTNSDSGWPLALRTP